MAKERDNAFIGEPLGRSYQYQDGKMQSLREALSVYVFFESLNCVFSQPIYMSRVSLSLSRSLSRSVSLSPLRISLKN